MTVAQVVSQAAAQLGIDGWNELSGQDASFGTAKEPSLATTLRQCMEEIGLSDTAIAKANDALSQETGETSGSTRGGNFYRKSGISLRRRAAAVAAELEIATGWG